MVQVITVCDHNGLCGVVFTDKSNGMGWWGVFTSTTTENMVLLTHLVQRHLDRGVDDTMQGSNHNLIRKSGTGSGNSVASRTKLMKVSIDVLYQEFHGYNW